MKQQLQWFWAYDVKHRAARWHEKALAWIAWRTPRALVYWCAVRLMSEATMTIVPNREPDQISIIDALKVWSCK